MNDLEIMYSKTDLDSVMTQKNVSNWGSNYKKPHFLALAMKPTAFVVAIALWFGTVLAHAQDQSLRAPLPTREVGAFAAVYDLLQTSLAKTVDGKGLMVSAIQGMVQAADPEGGEYLTEEAMTKLRGGLKADVATTGVEVRRRGLTTTVIPVAGGAALAAGVRSGDELRMIDGKDLAGESLDAITAALAGPIDSQTTLTLYRPSIGHLLDISVRRSRFTTPPPTVTRYLQNYLVLRIHDFRSDSANQLSDQLRAAWTQGQVMGIVLDLRGNPGGRIDAAVSVCALFLPLGSVIATSKGPSPESNQTFLTDSPGAFLPAKEVPLSVLVDEGTSASAEIVSAALRDHKRARLVGRPTFGRGSIQTIQMLPGGSALKYTIAFWHTPLGHAIQGNPLVPDRLVPSGDLDAELSAAIDEVASLRK